MINNIRSSILCEYPTGDEQSPNMNMGVKVFLKEPYSLWSKWTKLCSFRRIHGFALIIQIIHF